MLLRRPGSGGGAITALREHADRLPDIIEARQTLEVKLAALAAQRRTDAEMADIDAALATMEAEIAAGDRGVTGDEQFHHALTVAAHSGLLARLMHEISELIRETRIESLSQQGRPRQLRKVIEESPMRYASRIRGRHPARWRSTSDWCRTSLCSATATNS